MLRLQGGYLAEAQAAVEGEERHVVDQEALFFEGGQEGFCFLERQKPYPAVTDAREVDPGDGVFPAPLALCYSPVDDASDQGQDVFYRLRGEALLKGSFQVFEPLSDNLIQG